MSFVLLKTARQLAALRDVKCSAFIPWTHLINTTTFMTKDGAMGSVIKLNGLAFEVADESHLSESYRQLSRFIQSLSENIAVYVTTHRYKQTAYPEGEFPEGFAQDFNTAYQKKLKHKALYANDLYLTLLIKGVGQGGLKGASFIKKYLHQANQQALKQFQEKQSEQLAQVVREALALLSPYTPELLGEASGEPLKSSHLLGFLGLLVNGRERPLAYPLMDLCQYLPERRVSMRHNLLEWQGTESDDHTFAALLSVKQYGHETNTRGLIPLLSADFGYISTHSFCRVRNDGAIDRMKKVRSQLDDVDPEGSSLRDGLTQAIDGVRSEYVSFGKHHHSLLVMGDSVKALNEAVAKATDIYRKAELIVVRETLNLEPGFFAQMPGNFGFIARAATISNENFVDFVPLYNYHHGYINGNHLGSALMQVESQGRTPLYLNFHDKRFGANKDNPCLGHTLIIAPPSAGKTTLLCAMDAMMKKYPLIKKTDDEPKYFFFDRDKGCEIYIRAMKGFYTEIEAGIPTGFNPLQLPDTPINRAFLKHWLSSLISMQALSAEDEKEISTLVERNYTLDQKDRRLSVIVPFLKADFPHKLELYKWIKSPDGIAADGELAYLFDNDVDTLNFDKVSLAGFDLTHLLAPNNKAIVTPVLAYLFHRIEAVMNGRLIGVYLDEAWQALNNPHFVEKLGNVIASWRKLNAYAVFITQFLSNILDSPLRGAMLNGGIATKIFLANSDGLHKDYVDGASLSEKEFEFIKTTGKASQRFLFKQEGESAVGRLNLEGLTDFLRVFSGNKKSTEVCQTIRQQVGDDPRDWLPLFFQHFKEVA